MCNVAIAILTGFDTFVPEKCGQCFIVCMNGLGMCEDVGVEVCAE